MTPSSDQPFGGARAYAESYGDTADWCEISDAQGRVIGHHRDKNGDGMRWFRAQL